jgi:hypothetical protein
MDEKTQAGSASELAAQTFAELGATGPVDRTILLQDRRFAGQKFRCAGLHAVLPAGSDEIAFYDGGGVLVRTVSLKALVEKKAA